MISDQTIKADDFLIFEIINVGNIFFKFDFLHQDWLTFDIPIYLESYLYHYSDIIRWHCLVLMI
jgi:hypothetical protein